MPPSLFLKRSDGRSALLSPSLLVSQFTGLPYRGKDDPASFCPAAQFRAAFATELSALRELRITETGQVFEILSAAYAKHEAAYTEYLQHVGALRRWWLRRNWMAYRGEYPKPPELSSEDQRYRLGHWIGSDIDVEETKRKSAMRAIGRLVT